MIKVGDCYKEGRAWYCITGIDGAYCDLVALWVKEPELSLGVSNRHNLAQLVENSVPISRTEFDQQMFRIFELVKLALPKDQSPKTQDPQPEVSK